MQLFIDSSKIDEIKTVLGWGIIDGITTNPTLIANTRKEYPHVIRELLDVMPKESSISLEVISTDLTGMLNEARTMSKLDERIVVKLPCTQEGIKATKILTEEGILVNVTLVFSVNQALLAAKAGAYFISPFAGRLNDSEPDSGNIVIKEIIQVIDNYNFESQVLYASVRNSDQVRQAAIIGADIVTCPFNVLESLVKHPLTDIGLDKFRNDSNESGLEAII